VVFTGVVSCAAAAQTSDGEATRRARETALARPVSPGAIALLAPHATDPTVIARLQAALADGRPDVRAVAARVAFATGSQALAETLIKALDTEQDPMAGAEMVRALTLIMGEPGDRPLLDLAGRLGQRAVDAWARVVERARPLDLLKPAARPAAQEFAPALGRALALAARRDVSATLATLESLAGEPWAPDAYGAMLVRGRQDVGGVPLPLVRFGIGHPGKLRTAALFHLANVRLETIDAETRADLVAAAQQASQSSIPPPSPESDGWESFLIELLARAQTAQRTARDLSGLIPALDRRSMPLEFSSAAVLQQLSKSEADAWAKEWPDSRGRTAGAPFSGGSGNPMPSGSSMRAAVTFVPGLAGEVAALAGCKPGDTQLAVWSVRYRASGQVRDVSPVLTPSEPCREASLALVMLEEATGTEVVSGGRVDTVLVAFRREILECHSRQIRPVKNRPIAVGGGKVVPPRKTFQRNADYPASAQQAGIQGVVIVEAIIGTSGCVEGTRVLRSVNPTLDFAALAAVVSWQYTPTVLDGQVVPVIMTVTVNFTLQP
jgi:TonB family protein